VARFGARQRRPFQDERPRGAGFGEDLEHRGRNPRPMRPAEQAEAGGQCGANWQRQNRARFVA
jgi:hypothetical protein